MNNNRKEDLYNAEFAANPYLFSEDGAEVVCAHEAGFLRGVEWADKNPCDKTIMKIIGLSSQYVLTNVDVNNLTDEGELNYIKEHWDD